MWNELVLEIILWYPGDKRLFLKCEKKVERKVCFSKGLNEEKTIVMSHLNVAQELNVDNLFFLFVLIYRFSQG